MEKDDVWYLLAGTERGQRTFRVDRVVSAEMTKEVAERPAEFELAQAWERVVDEVELRRSGLSATVLIDSRLVPVLQKQFGRQSEVGATLPDGRVRVRLEAPTALMIAQPLAGWGAAVEVEDSADVRAELARLGAELVGRYGA